MNPIQKLGEVFIRYGLVIGFLLKDAVLLGAALFTLGDSLAGDRSA